jgi:hypothetical protein
MTQNIYTLITYIAGEEGWHDRCGDYHSGKESELEKQYFNDKNEAANAFGRSLFLNNQNDNSVTFLINGIETYPCDYECVDLISKEELEKLTLEYEEIDDLSLKVTEQLRLEKIKQDEISKMQKEAQEALRKKKEREYIENQERAELVKLMTKYGK